MVTKLDFIRQSRVATVVEFQSGSDGVYRSRATNGRSQLVATPLSLQAKTHFLCVFYVVIWTQK